MDKLLSSRNHKDDNIQKLQKISPQKYGKNAYLQFTYTPSKLADNILYREASHMKKIQQQICTSRQLQSRNIMLENQVSNLKIQKQAIQNSLNKMIDMYKQIISKMQLKNEERIKKMQYKFNQQISIRIKQKDQQSRYVQSEKQLLEQRIYELQHVVSQKQQKIIQLSKNKNQVQIQLEELKRQFQNLQQKYYETIQQNKKDKQKLNNQVQRIRNELSKNQTNFQQRIKQQSIRRQQEISQAQRVHKAQMQKLQSQRSTDVKIKNKQLNQLARSFQTQTIKLQQIIDYKDKMIDQLTMQHGKQKARLIALNRQYQSQITHLTHEKKLILQDLKHFQKDNELANEDKIKMTQLLEAQNLKLRDLLYQSSLQLQKCRSQMMGLAKDNSRLVTRMKSSQQQAKTWRQSYYLNKNRPIL